MTNARGERTPPLLGREVELTRLRSLLDPHRKSGAGLVIIGDAGLGKSTLLDRAAAFGHRAGWTVLRSRGGRSETDVAFAGLHQLVHGVLDRDEQLSTSQRSALRAALGLDADGDEPTPLRVGVALLSLLSAVAVDAPLLLAVDDAQWIDSASLDALAFVVRRAAEEPIVLLVGARGAAPPRALAPLPRMALRPLDPRTSGRLLDAVPQRLEGPDRTAVLAQAAGNPLALVELARAVASSPGSALRWATDPLPLTDRLHEVFGASLDELPDATRRALLLAAVADAGDGAVLRVATAQVPPDDWHPAEDAGVVTVEGAVRFRHPLLGAAVYRAATPAERRRAHHVVAELLQDYPDRRAWHLAATAMAPDEEVANHLESSAVHSGRRGAYLEASRALQRAAEFSEDRADRARRLVRAAEAALQAGDAAWVVELVSHARASTDDPEAARLGAHLEASALATTLDHEAARTALRRSIEASMVDDPPMALSSLTTAALVAAFTGEESMRQEVLRLAGELEPFLTGHPFNELPIAAAARLWVAAALGAVDERDPLVTVLDDQLRRETSDPEVSMSLGAAAMVLDETDTGVRLLGSAADRGRVNRAGYASAATLTGLAWVCVERGRWDEALAIANEGAQIAIAGRQAMYIVSADTVEATVAALRGDLELARTRIASVLSSMDPGATAGLAARARQATALVAQAEGDYGLAFHELSQLFSDDGTPTHYQRSWYGLADLAASAVRAGESERARALVEGALRLLSGPLRPRLQLQVDRARALLAPTDAAAESFFRRSVASANLHVPFELAQARLEFGEWLRRRRRVIEARTMLEAAREEFERLGASPAIERTMIELRASGIRHTERVPDAFASMTPQQQRIARLAASGLTNREIAERLFLSPRTISTHLYAIFPILQITARAQLHEVVPPEGDPG